MNSEFFKLDLKDVAKGAAIAALVALLGIIQQSVSTHGLDFAAFDWALILDTTWKATTAYLAKNLLSDNEGKVLGKIG